MAAPTDAQTDANQNDANKKASPEKQKKRMSPRARMILSTMAVVALALLIGWFIYFQLYGKYLESTDDAFINADNVTVAPRISGYVEQVYVADNQVVQANQPLVRIDSRDYTAQAAQSKAQIDLAIASEDQAKAALQEQAPEIAQDQAQLASAEEDARYAAAEVARYTPLVATGAETAEHLTTLRNQSAQMKAKAAERRAALEAAQLKVHSLEAQVRQAHAQGENARAQYDASKVNLGATEVLASVAGRIGDKQVRVGQYVAAGTRMMTVVPVQFYVVANFKETQVGMMRIGQPAVVKVDALPGVSFHGHVESLSPGTGAQFSLLPPQNATGNFTKIVQRVPVRIAFDGRDEDRSAFAAGLSVDVEVDTTGAKDAKRADHERNDKSSSDVGNGANNSSNSSVNSNGTKIQPGKEPSQ